MAQLAIAALGAAIGGATGIGATLGWTIGAAVGGYFFADSGPDINQEGARLEDLRVTSSAYGQTVPLAYGTVSLSGNLFQSSEIRETVHTRSRSGGGKGGGGQTVTETNYTYDVDLALGLCEGPVQAILQIYANEQLIYDASGTAEVTQPEWLKFRLLKGTEEQVADPTLQALTGDDTPAYKGLAYVVFDGFELAMFGNVIPNFRFVVLKDNGTESHPVRTITNPVLDGIEYRLFDYTCMSTWDGDNGLIWTSIVPNTGDSGDFKYGAVAIDPFSKEIVRTLPMPPNYQPNLDPIGFGVWKVNYFGRTLLCFHSRPAFGDERSRLTWMDANSGEQISTVVEYMTTNHARLKPLSPIGDPHMLAIYPDYSGAPDANKVRLFGPGLLAGVGTQTSYITYEPIAAELPANVRFKAICPNGEDGTTVCVGLDESTSNGIHAWIFQTLFPDYDELDGSYISNLEDNYGKVYDLTTYIENHLAFPYDDSIFGVAIEDVIWDTAEQCFWVLMDVQDALAAFQLFSDGTTGRFYDFRIQAPNGGLCVACGNPRASFSPITGKLYSAPNASSHYVYDFRHGEVTTYSVYQADVQDPAGGNMMFFAPTNEIFVTLGNGSATGAAHYAHGGAAVKVDGFADGIVTLQEIVDDVMVHAQYQASEWDSSELASDVVEGHRITGAQAGRAALMPLAAYGKFDIVDSEAQLKFRKRGRAVTASIPEGDLAAHYDGERTPRKMEKMRAHETSLPQRLNVKYIDKALNYEVGSQRAFRRASISEQEQTLDLPIVLTHTKAAQFADIHLHLQHIERMTYTFNLPYEYSYLEPGDVITVTDAGNVYRVRITQMDMDRGVIRINAVADLQSAYVSSAIGQASAGIVPAIIESYGYTQVYAMNLPALRDADVDTPYWFLGAGGTSVGWRGGAVYSSLNQEDYALISHFNNLLIAGTMMSVPSWNKPYPDTDNVYRVVVANGSLATITHDEWLRGEKNVAMLQGLTYGRPEIICFKDATLVSGNTWEIRNVKRGLFGTEQREATGVSVLFRLLDAAKMDRVSIEQANIGTTLYLRGVSDGSYLYGENVTNTSITQAAANMTPYAPTQTQAAFVSRDVSIQWEPRDRARARALHDPVNSDPNNYEIDVLDGPNGNVLNTYTVTGATSYTYLQANRTTDYGSDVDYFYGKIYRKSSLTEVGRGWGAPVKCYTGIPPFLETPNVLDGTAYAGDNFKVFDGSISTEYETSSAGEIQADVSDISGMQMYAINFYAHSLTTRRPTSVDIELTYRDTVGGPLNTYTHTLTLTTAAGWQAVQIPIADARGLAIVQKLKVYNPSGQSSGNQWGFAEIQVGVWDW